MATEDEVFALVVEKVSELMEIPSEKVTPDKRLKEDLGMDDLDIVEVVGKLELSLAPVDTDVDGLVTIRDLVQSLYRAVLSHVTR